MKDKKGEDFIERPTRILGKYRGSLVLGTQNIDDFYSSPIGKAALMNSDWLYCLKQKKGESIALLKKTDKFRINDYQQKMLESDNT